MKKFLSIILALALVLSIAPMTFAAEGEILHPTGDPVVYNFTTGGNAVKSGQWRIKATYTYDNMSVFFVEGSRRAVGNNGNAFKITVADDGMYMPTFKYLESQYGGIADIYILSAADVEKNGWDMSVTQNSNSSTGVYNGTDQALLGIRTNKETPTKMIISSVDSYNGDNTGAFSAFDEKFTETVSCDEPIELTKGDYYIIFSINSKNANSVGFSTYDGSTFAPISLSLQKMVSKTHKFVFGSNMLADSTIEAATADGSYFTKDKRLVTTRAHNTGASTGEQHVDEYSDFDISKGTNKWAVSRLGGASLYLYPEYAQFYTYKVRYGNNNVSGGSSSSPNINTRFVLKIDVEYPGTYDIEAEMYNLSSGTEADVYIVETSKVDGSELLKAFADYDRMTLDFLKTLPIDGRIGNIGADKTTSTDFITTKELKKGEYYIILHANSNNNVNVNASNGTQLLCLKSITMTESDGSIVNPETPVNAKANVSFATNIDGTIATDSVARGTSVSISAPETDKAGNKFKCWVRGTEANGVWVSSKANDTFKVMTNTYLTAVYEAPAAEGGKVVEFYNENGQYIETVAAVDGKAVLPATNPTLTGYEFAGWYTDEETELKEGAELSSDVTYAVAKYTAKQVIGTIANDNVKVNGAASNEYKFGAPISGNDNKAKYWLRNGKIVKFGTSYEYLVWDGANIMSSYDTTTAIRPTVVIDTTSVDGAYMIEYDKGNKSIAEVGILFGNSEKITVDSCKYKATSQWNRDHGQFMAKPYGDTSESFARGYLIYNDGGSYKVIYTDAIEIK